MMIDFTIVLVIGGLMTLVGFILMLLGTKWIKPWGKQYKIIDKSKLLVGLGLFLIGMGFILWQAIIRQQTM